MKRRLWRFVVKELRSGDVDESFMVCVFLEWIRKKRIYIISKQQCWKNVSKNEIFLERGETYG